MDGKNSFILYCDIGQHLELLSDEDAGLLFKGIVHYADTGEPPQLPADIIEATSNKYIQAYELITGQRFVPANL